jgi:hypothetical protein
VRESHNWVGGIMHVNIVPVDNIVFAGASIETQVVLRSVRSCILQDVDRSLSHLCFVGIDWQNTQNVALQNKLATLMWRGLDRSVKSIPANLQVALEQHQLATVQMNTVNLVTLRYVIPKLESTGLKAIVLKGLVAQKIVHGDFFSKPSYDVDLLVSPSDYEMASRLIASNGFALVEECASPWWKIFLGEQHFISNVPTRTAVDLHYRTQQPGSPLTRETQSFISQSVSVLIDGIQVRTLCPTDTCLLSCMSLSKALIHREPAGGHVCDIAAIIKSYRSEDLKHLFNHACSQGLRNTLVLGLRSAGLLYGVQVQFETRADENVLSDTSNADLLRMILSPWSTEIRWPRRSKILWDLCDDKRAYLQAIAWKISGDLCRRLHQVRPLIKARTTTT